MTLEQILEKTKNIRLVAASKYVDANIIEKLFTQGITEFGENQVQALVQKKEILDKKDLNIKWHFIGLQKHGAKICSMGMSNDFEIAIKCGSNLVRLGSILFKNLK